VAYIEGMPLREQVVRMLRYSNNYIADVLTMNLAVRKRKDPPSTLADGASVLSDYVSALPSVPSLPRTEGKPELYSGSGLTPENRISAEELVRVLAHQYRNTDRFPGYYGGLVVPGDAPFRYLKNGDSDWRNRVALKTGTLRTAAGSPSPPSSTAASAESALRSTNPPKPCVTISRICSKNIEHEQNAGQARKSPVEFAAHSVM